MSVGKRIYLKREMPDPEIMAQFKTIPASNTADVMGRSCAMNPRIRLVSKPKDQMMVGPAYTVKCRAGDIILADPDGIICIPRKDAAVVLEDAKKFQAADEKKLAAAKDGTANRAWVEKSLNEKGFEIIDDIYHP